MKFAMAVTAENIALFYFYKNSFSVEDVSTTYSELFFFTIPMMEVQALLVSFFAFYTPSFSLDAINFTLQVGWEVSSRGILFPLAILANGGVFV